LEPSTAASRAPWPSDLDPGLLQRRDERLRLAGSVHHDCRRLVLSHNGGDLIDDPGDALSLVEDFHHDAVVVHPSTGSDDRAPPVGGHVNRDHLRPHGAR
jgi:hypothetical protein